MVDRQNEALESKGQDVSALDQEVPRFFNLRSVTKSLRGGFPHSELARKIILELNSPLIADHAFSTPLGNINIPQLSLLLLTLLVSPLVSFQLLLSPSFLQISIVLHPPPRCPLSYPSFTASFDRVAIYGILS